jgi:ADP-ribose pyrophosphatase YjhB (NUDIX family)
MTSPRHSVSVAAVITDDHDRALLIQRRDNQHWKPPGGVLELGETIEDACGFGWVNRCRASCV